MAFTPRDNSGVLFKNDKDGNDKRPDYRGNAMIDGAIYDLAAWVKEGKKGKFLSVSFKSKSDDDRPNDKLKEGHAPRQTAPDDDFGDKDIPF